MSRALGLWSEGRRKNHVWSNSTLSRLLRGNWVEPCMDTVHCATTLSCCNSTRQQVFLHGSTWLGDIENETKSNSHSLWFSRYFVAISKIDSTPNETTTRSFFFCCFPTLKQYQVASHPFHIDDDLKSVSIFWNSFFARRDELDTIVVVTHIDTVEGGLLPLKWIAWHLLWMLELRHFIRIRWIAPTWISTAKQQQQREFDSTTSVDAEMLSGKLLLFQPYSRKNLFFTTRKSLLSHDGAFTQIRFW